MKMLRGLSLLSSMIASLTLACAARSERVIVHPVPDQQCMGSPLRIGSDNLPIDGDRQTTIIDIWAFTVDAGNHTLVWEYQTVSSQMWLQANLSVARLRSRLGSTLYARIVGHSLMGRIGGIPIQVSASNLRNIENALARKGIDRQQCFSQPLQPKYL